MARVFIAKIIVMRKFFVDDIKDKVILSGADHKHLSVVCRAKKGEKIVLCDGYYDGEYEIIDIKKDFTSLLLLGKTKNNSETAKSVDLYFCAMKGEKNDFAVQKCTELGVKNFYPVISEYVQSGAKNVNVERLSRIAEEASKQCGRGAVPRVHLPVSFAEAARKLKNYSLVVFPYESEKDIDIKSFLQGEKNAENIAILVGCEGGFSVRETEELKACGITPVTLGNRILRAETACIATTSVVMYEIGELRNL